MKLFINNIKIIFLLSIIITACNQNPKNSNFTENIIVSETPKSSITPTLSLTRRPTATLRPSAIITPSIIPSLTTTNIPTKEVFIQYGIFGGDGGLTESFYMGRGTPLLILYTDGELLYQDIDVLYTDGSLEYSKNGKYFQWFGETWLSVDEMCQLYNRIKNTGFMNIKLSDPGVFDPFDKVLYNNFESILWTDGNADLVTEVNGPISQTIGIYYPQIDNAIPEIRHTIHILENYKPPNPVYDYKPDWALLWIAKGRGWYGEDKTPLPWPTSLPRLSALWKSRVITQGFFEAEVVVLQGDLKEKILGLFQNKMAYRLFIEDGQIYNFILRPLLPHETINDISPFPGTIVDQLPFSCN